MVDAHALGACIARCEGSSPFSGTQKGQHLSLKVKFPRFAKATRD